MGGSKLSLAEIKKKKKKKLNWTVAQYHPTFMEKQGAKTIRKGISSPLSDQGFKPHIESAQKWPTCMRSPLAAILKQEEEKMEDLLCADVKQYCFLMLTSTWQCN